MAATVTTTVLNDGPRNLILLVNIAGTTDDITDSVLVDRSAYAPADGTELVVQKIEGLLTGFTATLSFDADANLVFVRLPDADWFCHDWEEIGGVSSNKAGAGANGDILITTAGFTGSGDAATFYLHMRKS